MGFFFFFLTQLPHPEIIPLPLGMAPPRSRARDGPLSFHLTTLIQALLLSYKQFSSSSPPPTP